MNRAELAEIRNSRHPSDIVYISKKWDIFVERAIRGPKRNQFSYHKGFALKEFFLLFKKGKRRERVEAMEERALDTHQT